VSSLRFRITYARSVAVLLVFALTWLIRRLLTLSFVYTRSRMLRREQSATRSLMLLAERLLKALIIVVAVFVCLLIVGVDTTTSLAGLGIAGLAIAVGAQKTVENFLGGLFLLSDKAIAVGDWCSISKRVGVVEDITLRSVRLRTLEQTLLSIPAGALSQDSIENFSTRGKILMNTTLRLRYGTSSEQLKAILDGIRRLLVESPQLESGSSRVRLIDFGVRAIELELFAYALTSDYSEFLSIREALLLRIAAIVESSGGSFASPERLELIGEPARAGETESYGRVP
jgi:MscS family membrane protein